MVRLKVRKSIKDVPNLRIFLSYQKRKADSSGDDLVPLLMLKKLTKVTDLFISSDYFKSYGTAKRKLVVQQEQQAVTSSQTPVVASF